MKKKTHRTERRGRKPGDGVLKNIDPKSSLLEKQVLLTYGRTAGNRLAERVRWFRFRHGRDMAKDSRNREFVDKRTRDLLERFQQRKKHRRTPTRCKRRCWKFTERRKSTAPI